MNSVTFSKQDSTGSESPYGRLIVHTLRSGPVLPTRLLIQYDGKKRGQKWLYTGKPFNQASRTIKLIIDRNHDLCCVHNGTITPLP
jgi:hypothetical protein